MKKISVVIPVYNSEKTFKECLQAVFSQDYPEYEVIVVNDASTDNSMSIASEFPCRIISLDENAGAGAARNRGAEEADGEILVFTDADCLVPPDWIRKISKDFENKNVGAVGGGYSFSAGNTSLERFAFLELIYRRKDFPEHVSGAVSNNLAFRKDIFQELGGFPEYFKGSGMEEIVLTFALSRKYKLLWSKENGVGHYFINSRIDYMRQQYTFAIRAALVVIFVPSLSSIEIFRHKYNFLQPLSFSLAHLSLLFIPFSFQHRILYFFLMMSIMYIFNLNFFMFLRKKEHGYSAWKAGQFLYLRNAAWTTGLMLGVIYGLLRKRKDLSKVWLDSYK